MKLIQNFHNHSLHSCDSACAEITDIIARQISGTSPQSGRLRCGKPSDIDLANQQFDNVPNFVKHICSVVSLK